MFVTPPSVLGLVKGGQLRAIGYTGHKPFPELPEVPLFLSGAMRRRNGHFCSHPLEIVISRTLCTHAHPGEAEHTLRHEMIHLWQHASGKKPDHGEEFRAWARRLDVHPRATRRVSWKNQRRP